MHRRNSKSVLSISINYKTISRLHDDVIKWKYFLRYWPFVWGNHPVTDGFPSQRPVTRGFDLFVDLRLSTQSRRRWFETPSCSVMSEVCVIWRHPTLAHEFQGFKVRQICISNAGTHGDTHQFGQSGQSRPRSWPTTRCPIAQTLESAPKQCAVMAIVEDKSLTSGTILRWLSDCICILSVG